MIRNMMSLLVCVAAACNAVHSGPRAGLDPGAVEETVMPSTEALIRPTPAMLAAALSGDPDAMASAAPATSCMASTTCPAQFTNCTGWSTAVVCADQCTATRCSSKPGIDTIKEIVTTNAFRACLDASQNACIQWQSITSTACSC